MSMSTHNISRLDFRSFIRTYPEFIDKIFSKIRSLIGWNLVLFQVSTETIQFCYGTHIETACYRLVYPISSSSNSHQTINSFGKITTTTTISHRRLVCIGIMFLNCDSRSGSISTCQFGFVYFVFWASFTIYGWVKLIFTSPVSSSSLSNISQIALIDENGNNFRSVANV